MQRTAGLRAGTLLMRRDDDDDDRACEPALRASWRASIVV
jgi:hypothetical protein